MFHFVTKFHFEIEVRQENRRRIKNGGFYIPESVAWFLIWPEITRNIQKLPSPIRWRPKSVISNNFNPPSKTVPRIQDIINPAINMINYAA